MLAKEKLDAALQKLLEAQKYLEQGNKRLAIGCLDFVEELTKAGIYVLIDEVIQEEGKF